MSSWRRGKKERDRCTSKVPRTYGQASGRIARAFARPGSEIRLTGPEYLAPFISEVKQPFRDGGDRRGQFWRAEVPYACAGHRIVSCDSRLTEAKPWQASHILDQILAICSASTTSSECRKDAI